MTDFCCRPFWSAQDDCTYSLKALEGSRANAGAVTESPVTNMAASAQLVMIRL